MPAVRAKGRPLCTNWIFAHKLNFDFLSLRFSHPKIPVKPPCCRISLVRPQKDSIALDSFDNDIPTRKISVGAYGSIFDTKTGLSVRNGMVKVTSVKGKNIVVKATRLRKRVRADTITFWVR